MLAARFFVAALWLTASKAVIYEGGPFREEAVCEVEGRLVGKCSAQSSCAGRQGADCGLPGQTLRCCAPKEAPPPAAHGQRSREACKKFQESNKPQSCDNFQVPAQGPQVRHGDFPYFAALGYESKYDENKFLWSCGGSLISEEHVLTTAVCGRVYLSTKTPKKVRLGDIDLQFSEGDENAQDIKVAEIFLHPDYNETSFYNDIAILKLAKKAKITHAVRPACLYTEDNVPVERAVVAGTGISNSNSSKVGILYKVDVPLIPNDKCNETYKGTSNFLPNGIDSTLLCAGEKGKDTCAGDSGAPLVVKAGAPLCNYQIIGITSFGSAVRDELPSGYTNVYPYIPWIENIVWK